MSKHDRYNHYFIKGLSGLPILPPMLFEDLLQRLYELLWPDEEALLRKHSKLHHDLPAKVWADLYDFWLKQNVRDVHSSYPNILLEPVTGGPIVPPKPAPVFDIIGADIVSRIISVYENDSGDFTFSSVLDENKVDSVTSELFPANEAAQSRLHNAIEIINDLTRVTEDTGDIRFALVEGLYARGFMSASSIARLSLDTFRRALIGTPATVDAPGTFTLVNPDGTLANCIPPEHLSPLGEIEYLYEILVLPTVYGTISHAIASRRGNSGDLLASEANLKDEEPHIDIVNENLEALASHPSAPIGQIFNSGSSSTPLTALSEHSSPALQIHSSAALDVSRSYLKTIGTSRGEVMRIFRENTTEFPIPVPDDKRPVDFEKRRWRFPVDFTIALEYLQISQEEYDFLYKGHVLTIEELQMILGYHCDVPSRPPSDGPSEGEPPVEEPPVEVPPVEEPPVEEPPVETTPEPDNESYGCTPLKAPAPEWKANQSYKYVARVRLAAPIPREDHGQRADAYFQNLIDKGLNPNEERYVRETKLANTFRFSSSSSDLIARFNSIVPDFWFGVAGLAGTPLSFQQAPVGNKLATIFSTVARILNTLADLHNGRAGLSVTEAGWDRREEEWRHTVKITGIEIEQIKRQILSAGRRCAVNLRELNNHQRQIEQSRDVADFIRDKFTKQDLYLFLQTETSRLYHQDHQLAVTAVRDALYTFIYERGDYGHTCSWANNLITPIITTALNGGDWESLPRRAHGWRSP
ncbi:hypothetical protein BJY01DRAFT_250208 [Aspergillus pseudoustus]|uniref:Tc toxin complex TcA C-terminal TcB-binding domain-containing protein n=1 Tax=Aspergillus pseudoustus TaxID=1810923 RepID=A0ABR4JJA6_9EURO